METKVRGLKGNTVIREIAESWSGGRKGIRGEDMWIQPVAERFAKSLADVA